MLRFARKYSRKFSFPVNLVLADAGHLPFAEGVFDWAILVATYHHIKGQRERQAALEELKRVLKPGGEAFITVWNRWQPRFWFRPKSYPYPGARKARPWSATIIFFPTPSWTSSPDSLASGCSGASPSCLSFSRLSSFPGISVC